VQHACTVAIYMLALTPRARAHERAPGRRSLPAVRVLALDAPFAGRGRAGWPWCAAGARPPAAAACRRM